MIKDLFFPHTAPVPPKSTGPTTAKPTTLDGPVQPLALAFKTPDGKLHETAEGAERHCVLTAIRASTEWGAMAVSGDYSRARIPYDSVHCNPDAFLSRLENLGFTIIRKSPTA